MGKGGVKIPCLLVLNVKDIGMRTPIITSVIFIIRQEKNILKLKRIFAFTLITGRNLWGICLVCTMLWTCDTYRVSQNTRIPSKWPYFGHFKVFFYYFFYRILLSGPIWKIWMVNFYSRCLLCQDNGYSVLRRTLDNAWECMIISVLNQH